MNLTLKKKEGKLSKTYKAARFFLRFFTLIDPYYFGVVPIIAQTAVAYGVDPVEIARASVLGQPIHAMSPLIASTHLLVGMAKVDFGEHQKFILKWAVGTCVVMILVALFTGAISL